MTVKIISWRVSFFSVARSLAAWGSIMNNASMRTADQLTHLKIVGVSLILGTVVVGIGIAARPTVPDMSTQLEARAPVLKAGQPVIWSGSEVSTTR